MPNFGPMGYGSYPYQNMYQQNQYATPFQTQPQPQVNQYAFVNGIEGAKSFQVAPGKTVLLVDKGKIRMITKGNLL